MKEVLARVTTKGQVTIPVEVRQLLGVSVHDRVAFIVEDDHVRLERRDSAVARTAGALKSDAPPLTAGALRQAAEEAIAEGVLERVD